MKVARSVMVASLASATLCSSTGCGGSSGAPGITTAPNVSYTFTNTNPAITPVGTPFTISQITFTFIGYPGQPAGQLYQSLQIDTTFTQDITNALPNPGTSLTSGGQLGLDTSIDIDSNLKTGNIGTNCDFTTSTGAEFFIDPGVTLGRLADGNYTVVAGTPTQTGPVEEALTKVRNNVLTQTVSLSALGSFSTVPKIGVAMIAVNGAEESESTVNPPFGDCAPASGEYLLGQ